MTQTRKPVHTGGCQCGAVRYALYAEPTNPHVCHCRMCQKASGNYFAAFAGVPPSDFAWVKGAPGIFKSSQAAERGFCPDCGTPLSFRYVDKDRISVSLGTTEFKPAGQGTKLIYTEQAVFLDGHDDAGSREQGTRGLFDNLAALLEREPAKN